ncbi:MAG: asparagine synthetase B, partial [Oscillospiraceae bacterium]|nr:asparagine synthetase B [Oscillospiraceae bacterium]
MCGFTGFVTRSAPPDEAALQAMGDTIRHRGPDGEGRYVDAHCGIAHRRLSIIDLEKGRQPIVSPDGRYVIAYNGETYNFRELR